MILKTEHEIYKSKADIKVVRFYMLRTFVLLDLYLKDSPYYFSKLISETRAILMHYYHFLEETDLILLKNIGSNILNFFINHSLNNTGFHTAKNHSYIFSFFNKLSSDKANLFSKLNEWNLKYNHFKKLDSIDYKQKILYFLREIQENITHYKGEYSAHFFMKDPLFFLMTLTDIGECFEQLKNRQNLNTQIITSPNFLKLLQICNLMRDFVGHVPHNNRLLSKPKLSCHTA